MSSSQNEVVPPINIRSPRLQPGKFVIGETKRLLQHYLPEGDIASLGILLMEQGLDVRASLRTSEYDEGSHRL